MCFVTTLKKVMEIEGVGQKDLGQAVGASQSAISLYLSKKMKMPEDIALATIKTLKNPRLLAEYQEEYGQAFFVVPTLDRIDDHHMTVIETLIEEQSESIRSLQKMKKLIKNKQDRKDLSEQDFKELKSLEMQVVDVYVAIQQHLISMSKFGIDVKELETELHRKMINKGYKAGHRKRAHIGAQI
ncbi:hypothetical protein [Defluviitalea saccharophila]|uniref:HTH cro/C1-type domain-containing protein n=1 Tax=Defluviitalea saccharophila TaxID=879970 RepID=A0ABZ2Y6X3_9FIRM